MKFVEFEQHILDITSEHHPGIFISVENLLLQTRAIIHEQAVDKTNHSIAVSIALFLYGYHRFLLENYYTSFDVALKYACFYILLHLFNDNLIILHPRLNLRSELFSTVLETYWSNLDAGQFSPQTNQGRSHFLSLLRRLNEDFSYSNSQQNSLLSIAFVAMLLMMSIELVNTLSTDLGVTGVVVLLCLIGKLIDKARSFSVVLNPHYEQPLHTFL